MNIHNVNQTQNVIVRKSNNKEACKSYNEIVLSHRDNRETR